jgi:hypothetical protein
MNKRTGAGEKPYTGRQKRGKIAIVPAAPDRIDARPGLPEAVRRAILALVEAGRQGPAATSPNRS